MGAIINSMPDEVKERYDLKDIPYKEIVAVVGNRKPIKFRSSWEYYYAIFLEKLLQEGKILNWEYEPQAFFFEKVKRGTRGYLPDFCVTHLHGAKEWVEIKGYLDDKSRVKLKRMAKYYPEIKIRVVMKEWFDKNLKDCKKTEKRYAQIVG
jgi:hypothetical protein